MCTVGLVGFAISARISWLSQHSAESEMSVSACTRSMPGWATVCKNGSPYTTRPLSSLLRSSVDVFAPDIAHIANLSFSQYRFPSAAFKTAQVLPLLKKPSLDKEQMSSYRPTSSLTTFSKIIERLVLNRLRPHLLASLCFARLQSAYRCGHSTETALLHVMNSVRRQQGSHHIGRPGHLGSLRYDKP